MTNKQLMFLIVDDFTTMQRILSNLLKELGFNNVEEAEDVLAKMNRHNFDFIITDWNLSNMDGLLLFETIRQHERWSKLPILMVTAETKKENIIAASKAGASVYVVKPFTVAILEQKIEQIIQKMA